ncbi:hypothetical protein [Paenarthrobacter nitroguajacolicus]|uniref:hypothetical protein n=1 Tax=Paenarthrobacter nitroguajacolicus TaxID=211146 RepID=UPI004054260E
MADDESVLVLPPPVPETAHELLLRRDHFFMKRRTAERDSGVKQVIPYIVVCLNDKILGYRRSGSTTETRLLGWSSIGWGGHIEKADQEGLLDAMSLDGLIFNCALREISEELSLGYPVRRRQLGLIVDNSTDVGRHHLGWAELWSYSGDEFSADERTAEHVFRVAISDRFEHEADLEPWSQWVLQRLA